jgi:dTMP kinase
MGFELDLCDKGLNEKSKPLFVSFEGIDGSGKTTQSKLFAEALKSVNGLETIWTREPGGTPTAEDIREIILRDCKENLFPSKAEALLYYASRLFHTDNVVKPTLDKGANVVTDRYFDSTVTYQTARGASTIPEMLELNEWCLGGFKPDLTFLINIPDNVSKERAIKRGQLDRLEKSHDSFMEMARLTFLHLANLEPSRFIVIDGSVSVEDVHAEIMQRFIEWDAQFNVTR